MIPGPIWPSIPLLLAKVTLLLLAALGVARALRRASAGTRHLVWAGALSTLVIVPALGAWGPVRLALLSSGALSTAVAAVLPVGMSPGLATVARGPSVATMLFVVWAGIALALAVALARGWGGVRRIVRRARPLDGRAWRDPLFEVADRLGLADAPRLVRSDEVAMPFACGLRHPTVVLPAASDEWTAERRRAVLLHEFAHVRRRDLVGHTFARVLCAVYWFHPLVWSAARRLHAESERACDDFVLAAGTLAPDYAEHLVEIAAAARDRECTPAVVLAMARRGDLEERVHDILDPARARRAASRPQRAVLVGVLALATAVVGGAAPAPTAAIGAVGRGAATAARTPRGWKAGFAALDIPTPGTPEVPTPPMPLTPVVLMPYVLTPVLTATDSPEDGRATPCVWRDSSGCGGTTWRHPALR